MPESIKELKGRELDALIAEKVMGWTRCPEPMHRTDNRTINGILYCPPDFPSLDYGGRLNLVPDFSSSIEAAMQVVEKRYAWYAYSHGKGWKIQCFPLGAAKKGKVISGYLFPEAICRAALAAIDSNQDTERR